MVPTDRPSNDRERSPGRLLRAARREARAFARLAMLLPLDLEAVVPESARDGEDIVVLVHGALATAGAWRPLRAKLASVGVHTATFTYGPMCGVPEIARAIGEIVGRLPARARVHLVGHSLGGLAVRWFVQEMPHAPSVVQTISVAAPFAGARGARMLPGPAGRDMQQGSAVLTRLATTATAPEIPHLSILGGADTAVGVDTAFPVGGRIVVADAAHNTLLFDEEVAALVIECLRSRAPEGPHES